MQVNLHSNQCITDVFYTVVGHTEKQNLAPKCPRNPTILTLKYRVFFKKSTVLSPNFFSGGGEHSFSRSTPFNAFAA